MAESQSIGRQLGGEAIVYMRTSARVKEMIKELQAESLRLATEQKEHKGRLSGRLQYRWCFQDRKTDDPPGEKQHPKDEAKKTDYANHREPETKEEHDFHFWKLLTVDKSGATVRTVSSVKDSFRGHRERFPSITKVDKPAKTIAPGSIAGEEEADEELVLV